jgi:hypothetical protein
MNKEAGMMADTHRDIEELLVDYADALRDGRIPVFLRSLTRQEAQTIHESLEFPEAADMVRLLNSAAFAHNAMTPDVGLFISRVDAKIASRIKQKGFKRPQRTRRVNPAKDM